MSKSVKKRDKKKKKKLTDKQILKLLKALKPHTQQIVRVNVGDKENKKKKPGEVQSSYNPPFVFPSQIYPAIINQGQPPYAPINQPQKALEAPSKREKELENLLERQKNDFEYQQQQFLIKQHKAQSAFERPYESEIEVEAFAVRPKRTYKKKISIEEEQPKFQPRITKTSQLASESVSRSASLYGDINTPTQNDKYLPAVIETNASSDQIGNIASPLSSDEFLFTPEGQVEPFSSETQAPVIETATQQNIPEEVISQFENPEEPNWAQTILKEEKAVLPPIPPEKTQIELPLIEKKTPELPPIESPSISRFGMIVELNNAIEEGYKIPSTYISSKGSGKGFLKKNITTQELNKLYDEYINK